MCQVVGSSLSSRYPMRGSAVTGSWPAWLSRLKMTRGVSCFICVRSVCTSLRWKQARIWRSLIKPAHPCQGPPDWSRTESGGPRLAASTVRPSVLSNSTNSRSVGPIPMRSRRVLSHSRMWRAAVCCNGHVTAAVMMTSTFMSGLPRSHAPQARTGGLC